MKALRITTWLASAWLTTGLAFAGNEPAPIANTSQANPESATLAKGQQKRGGARDGSGDNCKDDTLAKGKQKRGGARDGTGDNCKDATLAKGKQKRGGDRKRDGSCQQLA
ncbi:MAG: hypothetical protein Q7R22_000715 [Verrucomicrobiota bacterium JB025]|nr:hypothetical protein [Verrucomicrobiota bacterium JB025]